MADLETTLKGYSTPNLWRRLKLQSQATWTNSRASLDSISPLNETPTT
jgi:hypothetical protein